MRFGLFLFYALLTLNAPAQPIDRVEPPFWWHGFNNPTVQLMIHGNDIGDWSVSVDHDDVALETVHRTDNNNYLFLDLRLTEAFKGGKVSLQFSSDEHHTFEYNYEFKDRREGSAQREGFNTSDAIYLITPDRFANGNLENDTATSMKEAADRSNPVGRHGGDIAGIEQHLDYLKNMGFTAVWPTPMLENNQEAYSYHGYSTTDHYRIDPRFGSNRDYQRLSHEARAQGIGLIQDIILNHIGSDHWWMDDLPAENWLNHPNNYHATTHYRTAVQDPYGAEIDRSEFADGWFVKSMPDLNQRNPLLANYLIQNTLWWIEYADLYGIRTDTYSYSDKHFLTEWTRRVMEEYPNFNIVGEEWSTNPNVIAYWQRGKNNYDGYTSYLPAVMDFPLYDNLRTALTETEEWGQGLIRVYESLANDKVYPDPSQLVIFAENHDTSRLYSYIDEDLDRFKIAMVMLSTLRGIPQFFYGSEVLATSPKERNDGAVRSDFPGGWPDDKINAFTGKGLTDAQKSSQNYLQALLNWRRGSTAIHDGKLLHFAPYQGVYVYFRFTDQERVMVAINHTEEAQHIDLERYAQGINGRQEATNVVTKQSFPLEEQLSLQPLEALVLELD